MKPSANKSQRRGQAMTLAEQIAFFEKNHYLLLPNALTPTEVAGANAAIDAHRAEHPGLWGRGNRGQSVHCFLHLQQLDFMLRHPSWYEVARQAMDDTLVFSEFSIMFRSGYQKAGVESWHRDFGPDDNQRLGITALSVIYYMTEVTMETPRYCLVPASNRQNEAPRKLSEDSEDREGELQITGPAGSALLVNAGIWHCGRWSANPAERRTVHLYLQSSRRAPVSVHNVFPKRLWDSPDAEQRRYFGHHNALTRAVVDAYSR
jgi:ectoine hydroxylase-related dioxygenase (phytanoyl-CoA dioxygenase family)